MRIKRDEMYIEIAKTVSKRGTCTRLQVGAIIVNNGGIIAEGYVGSPKGMPHCEDG
jgi:dCMP deaminase